MKIKLVTTTWSNEETFPIEETSLYRSFVKFNSKDNFVHYHFNRGHHMPLESEFYQRFDTQSDYILYKIYLLLAKVMLLDADYIVFCDANDVTCLRNIDYLPSLYDLNNNVIFGTEKNQWPVPEKRLAWPDYQDYSDYNKNNQFYLNSGVILAKKDMYVRLMMNVIDRVLPKNLKTFCSDQGVYTWHYTNEGSPGIKLDTSGILAVNTFTRSVDEYYMQNNTLYSKKTGVTPCFVHDNGWDHGSPRYNYAFELKRLYSDSYPHLKNISKERPIPLDHSFYLQNIKDSYNFTPRVIYDIGACVLHWTTIAKEVWPGSEYILFEAMEESKELFEETPHRYHIDVLGDEDGKEITFYKNVTFPGGNSYYIENSEFSSMASALFENPSNQFKRVISTLDSIVQRRGFPLPDLLKIDVQGCEVDILKGAQKTLQNVKHLIVELQHVQYNKGAQLAEDSIPFIESLGFKLVTPRFSTNSNVDADYHFIKE